MTAQIITPLAEHDGHLVLAEAYRVYPQRWAEATLALGSMADHFSIAVQRLGNGWIIARGQWRYSPVAGDFIIRQYFGAETCIDSLDEALTIAARLAEKRTNPCGETFAQVAARVLDRQVVSATEVSA